MRLAGFVLGVLRQMSFVCDSREYLDGQEKKHEQDDQAAHRGEKSFEATSIASAPRDIRGKALDDARATLWNAGDWLNKGKRAHTRSVECHQSILALRYSVSILDRLGWTPLPAAATAALKEPIIGISKAAQAMIKSIGGLTLVNTTPDALPTLKAELQALRSNITELLTDDREMTREAREHLGAVAWAWATLAGQLERAACRQCGDSWRT